MWARCGSACSYPFLHSIPSTHQCKYNVSIYPSVFSSIHLTACLSTYRSIDLPSYLSAYPADYLSIYRSIDLSVCLSPDLSIYLSIFLSTYLCTYTYTLHIDITVRAYIYIYIRPHLALPPRRPCRRTWFFPSGCISVLGLGFRV